LAHRASPIRSKARPSTVRHCRRRSRFESSKQRFFGQLLLSMKLPSLLPAIEDALATDHSVVIQLVSTAEALLDRRLADLSPRIGPRSSSTFRPAIVADYLDNAFPTRAMESYWDEDGNERSRPMVDEAGNPVHSQEALRIKAETLELLGAAADRARARCDHLPLRHRCRGRDHRPHPPIGDFA
jgi:hypothetical protein